MLRRTSIWILTAAIALCAGAGVPISRLEFASIRVSIVWRAETAEVRQARRPQGKPREFSRVPRKVGDEQHRALSTFSSYTLYNRPPPIAFV